jgi:predicted dehydrogenase
MKDLRLGIIGCGRRVGLATHAHRPHEGVRVTACCDLKESRFETCKTLFGNDILTTADVGELVEQNLDAVFVLSPDGMHEEHAVAALVARIPVYLEKPMAITIDGCDRILRAAKKNDTRLFVGHNMRYMTIFRKMKKLIDEGKIGEVKSIWCRHFVSYGGDAYFRDWHADQAQATGLLLQKGAHDIDVIHWLSGAYSTRVSAFGNLAVYGNLPRRSGDSEGNASWYLSNWPPGNMRDLNPIIDVEDQTVMIMQLEGGILGSYLQCHFTPDACRNYTVIGTEGRIENIGDGAEDPIFLWNRRTDRYHMVGDEVHRGDPVSGGGHGGADPLIVDEFLRFVREEIETTATPVAARMSVATGCQATASLRDGGTPRDIPPIAWDKE